MKVKLLQVGPLGTNCYILEDEETREAAVIDPGGDAPAIEKALEGAELRYILLTHGHNNHTTAARRSWRRPSRRRRSMSIPRTAPARTAICSPWRPRSPG